MAGPDPARPRASSEWASVILSAPAALSPAAAVPVSAKMPVPMIAPTPRQVRSSADSERFILRSGSSDSWMSNSGLLVLKEENAGTAPRVSALPG